MTDDHNGDDHNGTDKDPATDHPVDGQPVPPVDGPTVMGPNTGHLAGPSPTADDQTVPTPPEPAPAEDEPTLRDAGQGWQSWPPSTSLLPRPGVTDEPTVVNTPDATSTTPDPTNGGPMSQNTAARAHGVYGVVPDRRVDGQAGPTDETTVADLGQTPPIDDPTIAVTRPDDEATIATTGPDDEVTVDGPTLAVPRPDDEATVANTGPDDEVTVDGPTVSVARPDDEVTTSVGADDVTGTGPTVGDWPFDQPEPPPPGELIWRVDPPPPARAPGRSPAYYIALGAAVVLVIGLVAAAAIASVVKPTQNVAGTAKPTQGIPEITTTSAAPPAPTSAAPPQGPLAAIAAHPLSAFQGRMADTTCALPRFDLPDASQAAFLAAAKTCADNAWGDLLAEADIKGGVKLVTVTTTVQTESCGEVTPTSAATQCDGTVYMTPTHLRDTEQNGRYPGRYLGVFLREYARALQFTSGLAPLVGEVTSGSAEDLDKRLAQQATCLAGVTSGAMASRGAVDGNITGEISARLTTVDAPPDAKAWLDKGFQARQLSACNTWN